MKRSAAALADSREVYNIGKRTTNCYWDTPERTRLAVPFWLINGSKDELMGFLMKNKIFVSRESFGRDH